MRLKWKSRFLSNILSTHNAICRSRLKAILAREHLKLGCVRRSREWDNVWSTCLDRERIKCDKTVRSRQAGESSRVQFLSLIEVLLIQLVVSWGFTHGYHCAGLQCCPLFVNINVKILVDGKKNVARLMTRAYNYYSMTWLTSHIFASGKNMQRKRNEW